MVSQAGALTGRWAGNPTGWAILLLPSMLLVAVQEATTPFPSFGYLVASGLLQHLAGGGLSLLVLALWRRLAPATPLAAVFGVWILSGVIRGLIGGLLAASYANVSPEFLFRIGYWVVAAVVWMPLFSYFFSQLDLRRTLLAERVALYARLQEEEHRAHLTATQLRDELASTVREALAPIVDDVRTSLSDAAAMDTQIPLQPISEKLEGIVKQAAQIIESSGDADLVGDHQLRASAPVAEALGFDRSRPLVAATLTAAVVAVLFLPYSIQEGGLRETLQGVAATVGGAMVMWAALEIAKRALPTQRFGIAQALMIFVSSGIGTLAVLLAFEVYPLTMLDLRLVIALPLGYAIAGTMLSGAVGIGLANRSLLSENDLLRGKLSELQSKSRARTEQVQAQVAELLHGPILGRLSACVMALNFFLAETDESRSTRRTATTEGVLAHLDLVAADFSELGLTPG